MPNPSAFLSRPNPPKALISLVPMIDVMLILLVFFMVTSTYLNLDMIPAVQRSDDLDAPTSAAQTESGKTILIRIGADGVPSIGGRPYSGPELVTLFAENLATDENLRILVLPSGAADMQALISVMDVATSTGAANVRVVRLEAAQ